MRLRPALLAPLGALLLACHGAPPGGAPVPGTPAASTLAVADSADVRRLLFALADDSLEGRNTGTPGGARAAALIADELMRDSVRPGGDHGYFQWVPLSAPVRGPRGFLRSRLLLTPAERDSVRPARRINGFNLVGVVPGTDRTLRHEYVLVDAHYDHLGIGPAVSGDSIYNGADDDASGTVAVLEIAKAFAQQPGRRTLLVLLTTGEEQGLLGTRWYIAHPTGALEHTVANLEIEMIGRPDSLAGGPGRAWLTGYDRSTMGDALRAAGIPIVPDPRPAQNFFLRSDNIAFAQRGIPAHTLSSFGLHADYHQPSDEASRVDIAHMTRVIDAAIAATRLLTDGPRPRWKPGGRPEARAR